MSVYPEGTCQNCGHDDSEDNLFFKCEWCGRAICSYCHRMTGEYEQVCQQCVDKRGISDADLEL